MDPAYKMELKYSFENLAIGLDGSSKQEKNTTIKTVQQVKNGTVNITSILSNSCQTTQILGWCSPASFFC